MRALAGGLGVVAAVRVWSAVRADGLTSLPDEVGFLGNAILLGGGGEVSMGWAPFYKGPYGLLLAPFAAVIDDPASLATAARLVNVVLLAATGVAIWVWLGRLFPAEPERDAGGEPWWGDVRAWAAVGATAAPGLWVAGLRAWPDALLALGWVGALLAVAALAEPARPLIQRVWFGPIVAALAASHDRFVPVALLAALLIVARMVTSDRRAAAGAPVSPAWTADAGNLAGGAAVFVAGLVIDARVRTRWDRVADGALARLLDDPVAALVDGVGAVVGQLWYLSAGTFGLAPVGALALVAVVRRSPWRQAIADPSNISIATALAGTLAVQVATALQVGDAHAFGDRPSFDLWANGRYQEVVLVPLVSVGLVTVGRLLRSPVGGVTSGALGGLAAATVALGAVTTVALGSGPPVVDRFNVAGATWALDLWRSSPAVIPTVLAAAVLGALALLVPGATGDPGSAKEPSGHPHGDRTAMPAGSADIARYIVPVIVLLVALSGWWVGECLVDATHTPPRPIEDLLQITDD